MKLDLSFLKEVKVDKYSTKMSKTSSKPSSKLAAPSQLVKLTAKTTELNANKNSDSVSLVKLHLNTDWKWWELYENVTLAGSKKPVRALFADGESAKNSELFVLYRRRYGINYAKDVYVARENEKTISNKIKTIYQIVSNANKNVKIPEKYDYVETHIDFNQDLVDKLSENGTFVYTITDLTTPKSVFLVINMSNMFNNSSILHLDNGNTVFIGESYIDKPTHTTTLFQEPKLDNTSKTMIYTKFKHFNTQIALKHIQDELLNINETANDKKYTYAQWLIIHGIPVKFKWSPKSMKTNVIRDLHSYIEPVLFQYLTSKNNKNSKNTRLKIDYKHRPEMNLDGLERVFSEFQTIQQAMDTVKPEEWHTIKLQINILSDLKNYLKKAGYTENITPSQAFLKMYEILATFNLLYFPKNDKIPEKLTSFHICEAPGQFLVSINHYLRTHTRTKDTKWDWFAQSLKPRGGNKNKNAFGDNYGLMKRHPENWIFGIKNDGDITSIENMNSYEQKFAKLPVNLMTGDCGVALDDGDYVFIEEKLSKLSYAQILTTLLCLGEGGNCVFKLFLAFKTPFNVSLTYILSQVFSELYAFKPSLNPSSTEFYFVCKNYRKSLISHEFVKLKEIFASSYNSDYSLLDVPEDFIYQHEKMVARLLENVENYSLKALYLHQNPDLLLDADVDLAKLQDRANREWVRRYEFVKLPAGTQL